MLVEAYIVILEKFAHSLEETEVVKEADEHVRFAVPQAVPPPVYRAACHGHVSLYVTACCDKLSPTYLLAKSQFTLWL